MNDNTYIVGDFMKIKITILVIIILFAMNVASADMEIVPVTENHTNQSLVCIISSSGGSGGGHMAISVVTPHEIEETTTSLVVSVGNVTVSSGHRPFVITKELDTEYRAPVNINKNGTDGAVVTEYDVYNHKHNMIINKSEINVSVDIGEPVKIDKSAYEIILSKIRWFFPVY